MVNVSTATRCGLTPDGRKTLAALFRETFGIQVNWWEYLVFRHLLARYYRTTYKALMAKIIAGPVLHVDETEVKLRTATGYVWVFANIANAVYIFRPSREGEFLRKVLKGFKGVLVSDFYSAYDGLECLQQRCLIHLIRDMNRAILDNPFDHELQSVTTPFGALLRSIVVTVDEHGLKRRYLESHSKDVATFFESLSDRVYDSDASKALQERLLRNRDRLFTLERELDAFSGVKRRRHRAPLVELYPKGFLPSSLASLRQPKSATPSMDTIAEVEKSDPNSRG